MAGMNRNRASSCILTSADDIAPYVTDYGKIRNCIPAAVAIPTRIDELQDCLEYASTHNLRLVTRGGAYSFLGQSLAANHMVVDLGRLHSGERPQRRDGNCVEVSAGMKLWDVQDHLTSTGHRLPVLTSAGNATIGGTLSIGGLSGRSYRRGFLVSHVREFTLMGTDGRSWRCSPAENPLLYKTALACQGMLGFVLDATITVEPLLPRRVKMIAGGIPARYSYNIAQRLRDYDEIMCLEGYIDWSAAEPMMQVHSTIEAKTSSDAERARQRWKEIMAEQKVSGYQLETLDLESPIGFSASIGGWDKTQALAADRTANTKHILLPLGFLLREADAASALAELGEYARSNRSMHISNSYFSMLASMSNQNQIWAKLDDDAPWVMGIDMLLRCQREEIDSMLRQAEDVWSILRRYNVRTYPYGSMPKEGLLHTLKKTGIASMQEAARTTDPGNLLLHRDLVPEINGDGRNLSALMR